MNAFSKWYSTSLMSISRLMAYRVDFILQVIGPVFGLYFLKFFLWESIYSTSGATEIQGMDLAEMINYHGFVAIVSLLALSHTGMNMAEEIRLGKMSTYLIYPFNFFEFQAASFIGFWCFQLFITFGTGVALKAFGVLSLPPVLVMGKGFIVVALASVLWFQWQFLTGILAFWLEETWIIRVILQVISNFLSGGILPLSFFPDAWPEILQYTPFPYFAHVPIAILMERFHGDFLTAVGGLLLWIIVFTLIIRFVWSKGVRLYTAAGM